ncbi:3-deoxy-D-manno-octulosonic acid transferase [Candidatus Pelagibacter sp.]|nr:3-deoxy-D-manno-octulosonic acid transferase [Candidatus Pelagibacter sp.]MDC1483446.1 3-deoxy-D-manno-octulosonic acid transferase [Pelagibacteraceae bacterium]
MFFLYQILITILLILSPLIIFFRILKKKEDRKRYKEKFCFPSKRRINGNLIWFHGSSVGELLSILPLVQELEKNKSINQILITTSTLSSAQIFKKYNLKKTVHQFFPIDSIFFSYKFLNYWKPTIAIFVESEIWPNIFRALNKKNIPLVLLNARITKKTFKKWISVKKFSNSVFQNISIAYPQNEETLNYLKKLNISKIKKIGNLKFFNNQQSKFTKLDQTFLKNINHKKIWCASSTHPGEEIICVNAHINLKKKYKNLLTIIIPRHIHRVNKIVDEIKSLDLNVVLHSSRPKKLNDTDIYLVDTYGDTKKFYQATDIVFMGKSISRKGGQNPLEPANLGSAVLYGSNVDNFKDTYKLLKKLKVAYKVNGVKSLTNSIDKLIAKPNNKKNYLEIAKIGKKILNETKDEINSLINNEIKKT